MSIPVPLRGDFDAPDLRRLARSSKDANQARRLLALATVYGGGTRSEAAAVGGVGLQIVLYMPVFRSMWCGRRSSPESLSST